MKAKTGDRFGSPSEMVSAEKRRRIRRAAEAWLAAHPDHAGCEVRLDVVSARAGRLHRIANAF